MNRFEQTQIEAQHRSDRILFDGLAGTQRAELIQQAIEAVCTGTATAWRARLSLNPSNPPRNLITAVAALCREQEPAQPTA